MIGTTIVALSPYVYTKNSIMRNSTNTGDIILATLTGAAIGAGLSILYAPESGRVTRTKLKGEAKRASKKLGNVAKELKGNVEKTLEEGGDELGYLIGSVIGKTSLSAQEVIRILETKIVELKSGAHTKVDGENPETFPASTGTK